MKMFTYWNDRFTPRRFAPAAMLIALASQSGSDLNAIRLTIAPLLALLLLAQFRLWDDLADRERDRPNHPERVLVCAVHVAPFVAACVGLAILNLFLALAWNGLAGLAALALLNAAALAWYVWRPAHRTGTSDLVLLAKYPAFVLVLGNPSAWRSPTSWAAALATYTAACAFEIWHDSRGPVSRHVREWNPLSRRVRDSNE
jgi:4-hydroxybenzoate polyprenyltransferase